MNLSDFFSGPAALLPRGGFEAADCTFDVFLQRLYRDYVAAVKEISDPEHHDICETIENSIPEIEQIARRIVRATKHFLQGYPHLAYQEIKNTLKNVEFDSLLTVVSSYDPSAPPKPFDFHLEATLHPAMYRMRPNFGLAAAGMLTKKDIFHVPFENRNLVRNQRYSIAGLPCLYLGSSIWICWEELDRPELNGCICSRFKFAEETTILDFQLPPAIAWDVFTRVRNLSRGSDPPQRIDELLARYNDNYVISYILYWPLIAASSIRVDSRIGAFFPQYIVPQLLLQWVTKEGKVDGIRYFSTRMAKMNHYVNVNYVFPTRDIQRRGCCSFLRRKIHLVPPVPWALLELTKKDPHEFSFGGAMGNRIGVVQLSDSMTYSYHLTKFYDLEDRLASLENQHGSGPVEA